MDDAAAIRSCRAGEADAFRYLVERYQKHAMAHAVAILGNRTDAEDALQEAFLDAYRLLTALTKGAVFTPGSTRFSESVLEAGGQPE